MLTSSSAFLSLAHRVAAATVLEPMMSDHVTLRISKPRITLYGALVTAIIGWGAYSIFWRRPAALPHRPLLPPHPITVPTPGALQHSATCMSTSTSGNGSKTLIVTPHQSTSQLSHEMNAVNACAGAVKSASPVK